MADPDQGPVVMLNLLKFKPRAVGEEGTGADAYRRYAEEAVKMVEARGGRVLWSGRPAYVVVGSEADQWDAIALVEYPSPRAFLEMTTNAEYQQVHTPRAAGPRPTAMLPCPPPPDPGRAWPPRVRAAPQGWAGRGEPVREGARAAPLLPALGPATEVGAAAGPLSHARTAVGWLWRRRNSSTAPGAAAAASCGWMPRIANTPW